MESIISSNIPLLLQLIIAIGLINVWVLRVHRPTIYRGGNAKNMIEEFAVYGLPTWMLYVVGATKITIALLMIVGIWYQTVVIPGAAVLGLLMIGAVAFHVKVHDKMIKIIPALSILVLAVAVLGATLFMP
ncbi:MAG: DoxX family protein [Candidatus Pacebacteria bacterium]|jgi:hypothetical protein|nr:DoxX family protein [Candidatus Paceibacterota bacterium]